MEALAKSKPLRTAPPSETTRGLSGFAPACVREAIMEKTTVLAAFEMSAEYLESINGIANLCQQGSKNSDHPDGKSGKYW